MDEATFTWSRETRAQVCKASFMVVLHFLHTNSATSLPVQKRAGITTGLLCSTLVEIEQI